MAAKIATLLTLALLQCVSARSEGASRWARDPPDGTSIAFDGTPDLPARLARSSQANVGQTGAAFTSPPDSFTQPASAAEASGRGAGLFPAAPARALLGEEKYVVPFLTGLGLNTQLREYKTAAAVAKRTGRTLCLAPFHRFYLDRDPGRPLKKKHKHNTSRCLPFAKFFSVKRLQTYVTIASMEECQSHCQRSLQCVLAFGDQGASVATWRPGSASNFRKCTEFGRPPKLTLQPKREFTAALDRRPALPACDAAKCVGLFAADVRALRRDDRKLPGAFTAPHDVVQLAGRLRRELFGRQPHLCVHWRVEERVCRGRGEGIGYGMALEAKQAPGLGSRVCLPSVTGGQERRGPAAVRARDLAAAINQFKHRHGAAQVLLATDCAARGLVLAIQRETGAKVFGDNILMGDGLSLDEVSRIEQRVCVEARAFMGSSYSAWSETVAEARHSEAGLVYDSDWKKPLKGDAWLDREAIKLTRSIAHPKPKKRPQEEDFLAADIPRPGSVSVKELRDSTGRIRWDLAPRAG